MPSSICGGKNVWASPGTTTTTVPPVAVLETEASRPVQLTRAMHVISEGIFERMFERMEEGRVARRRRSLARWWEGSKSSTAPGPAVVKIVLAQHVRAVEQVLVEIELAGGWILEVANGIEEHLCELQFGRYAVQCVAQRGGPRNVVSHHGCEGRELHLIVVDENGAVLEERVAAPPLRATDELSAVQGDFTGRGMMEARERATTFELGVFHRRVRPIHDLGIETESVQRGDQQTIDAGIRFREIAGVQGGTDDRVRHLAIVKNRAAAGGPANHLDPTLRQEIAVIGAQGSLIATEGQRRRAPGVDAEDPLSGSRRMRHQRLIHGHVVGAGRRRRMEKTPHRGRAEKRRISLTLSVDSKRRTTTERYIVYADAAFGTCSAPRTISADLRRRGVS